MAQIQCFGHISKSATRHALSLPPKKCGATNGSTSFRLPARRAPHLGHQFLEALFPAQAVPSWIQFQPNEPVGALFESLAQPMKRVFGLVQASVNQRPPIGGHEGAGLLEGIEVMKHL